MEYYCPYHVDAKIVHTWNEDYPTKNCRKPVISDNKYYCSVCNREVHCKRAKQALKGE